MFTFTNALQGRRLSLRAARATRRQPLGHRLTLEALEERQLLTAVPVGDEIAVTGDSNYQQVAADAAGNFMVVWQAADVSGQGVFARRYDAEGMALGNAFQVNTATAGDQTLPFIAMNAAGQSVVSWQSAGQNGAGGLFAQVYDTMGAPVGGPVQINTTTTGGQHSPNIAIDGAGNFVAVWPGGSTYSGQRFNSTGAPLGGQFTTPYAETVAMNSQGEFITFGSSGSNLAVMRYAADGTAIGSLTTTGLTNATNRTLRAALNDQGEILVAIASESAIQAARFDDAGISQGEPFGVTVANNQALLIYQDFGMTLDDRGNSAFSWDNLTSVSPWVHSTVVQQYDANGLATGASFTVNESALPGVSSLQLAVSDNGQMVAVWTGITPTNGPQLVARRIDAGPLRFTGLATTQDEDILPGATPVTEVRGLVASFSEPLSTAGGTTGEHSATNPANWLLLQGDNDITSRIVAIAEEDGRVTLSLDSPLRSGTYRLTARQSLETVDGSPLDGDNDGVPGGDYIIEFSVNAVYPVGDQFEIGQALPLGSSASLALAANGQGDFFALRSNVVSGKSALLAYPYHADGTAAASAFIIDPAVLPSVGDPQPQAAVDGDGNLVVAWRSTTRSGISVQKFSPTGAPLSAVVQITATGAYDLAMAADDSFAVSYIQGASAVQLFNADGTTRATAPLPAPFYDSQTVSRIAFTEDGNLVAAWRGEAARFGHAGVYALRMDPTGTPLGNAFLVREDAAGQSVPVLTVEGLSSGGFVIAWQNRADSITNGNAYARVYGSDGNPLGSAFVVHSVDAPISAVAPSSQFSGPVIAADGSGHFVIATSNLTPTTSGTDIFARGFYDNGTPLGRSIRVNTLTNISQLSPVGAADGDGDIWIGWRSPALEFQRFGITNSPVVDLNGVAPGIDNEVPLVPGGGPVNVGNSSTLTVTDPNSSVLARATVTIAGALPGDVLSVDTAGTSIAAAYADGTLLLTGNDTLAHYQQVLRSVVFDTTAARPASSAIDIAVVINDGTLDSTDAHSRIVVYEAGSSTVADRHVFYKHFGVGSNGVAAADDANIATDKVALLPGQTATFANYTSYAAGLNGIMIDLGGTHGAVSLDDFTFKLGNNNDPNSWVSAPTPAAFGIRAGAGVSGSDRIELIWESGFVNQWLQVTLAANAHTGLAQPDVFYFGNAAGDSGNSATDAWVNVTDQLAVRNHATGSAAITNPYDYNRDGHVDSSDELWARNHPSNLGNALRLITAPGPIVVASSVAIAPAGAILDPAAAIVLSAVGRFDAMPQAVTRLQVPENARSVEAQTVKQAAAGEALADWDQPGLEKVLGESEDFSPDDDWLSSDWSN